MRDKRHRIASLFMAAVMLFMSINFITFLFQTARAEVETFVVRDDALHFIIRHWHTDVDDEVLIPGNSLDADDYGNYFVLVEGYIMPRESTDDDTEKFDFFLVDQGSGKLIKYGDGDREDELTDSPYIVNIDEDEGVILLSEKPLMDGGDPLENFAGFSISAGQGAVRHLNMESTDPDTGEVIVTKGIEIKYDSEIRLVKGHAFYTHSSMIVDGVPTTTVSGGLHLPFDEASGIDTVEVYTYIRDCTTDGTEHKAGEIVMSADDSSQACMDEDDLPSGLTVGVDVQLAKFYSAVEGLHTDRYVVQTEDGRTFLSNLQTWYVEGVASQVGLVLDASGSMIFALDEPNRIQLTKDQLALLEEAGLKKLTAASDPNDADDSWSYYFLTDEVLDKILNPRNTDNSLLSSSGYSYYVKSKDGYAPLGYWEGVITPKTDKKIAFKASDVDITTGWPESHRDLNMSGNNGFHTSGMDGNASQSSNGILLDAAPSGQSFTISFNLITSGSGDPDNVNRNIAELLYIGPMSGSTEDGGYYRLIRDMTGNSARLRGNQSPDRGNWVTDINNVFGRTATQRVTLVFKDGTVTSYLDGSVGQGGYNINNIEIPCTFSEGEIRIILNGIQDSYDGAPIYIDELYVFDDALTAEQVKDVDNWGKSKYPTLIGWYEFANSNPKPDPADGTSRNWLKNSISGNFASKLTGQLNITNNAPVAVPTVAKTSTGATLGSINTNVGDATLAASFGHTHAGWYFITHAGSFKKHYEAIGTGKRLIGLNGTQTTPSGNTTYKGVTVSDDISDSEGNTKFEYHSEEDTPTLFYVDAEGYLRCFYETGGNTTASCSYVYELVDEKYIRTEALQRVLGSFTTTLSDRSPASQVSAVRYSSADTDFDLSKLVLLDWTSDPNEMANLMSLTRGDGGAKGFVTSSTNGLQQYNYGLTGSTNTYSGLKAYYDYLRKYDYLHDNNDYNDEGAKYLIIFTDGNDTSTDKTPALEIADDLKEEGYVIFTVILAREDEATDATREFLPRLAGREGVTVDPKTGKGDDGISYFFWTDDIDSLTNTFLSDILSHIAEPLKGYTVQDYIDPRFDLVERTADGDVVWHLNAAGDVALVSKKNGAALGSFNVNEKDPATGEYYTIHLSGDTNPGARDPYLHFDKTADMYYLVWEDQNIPTSAVGANRIAVWNAQLILRAKEDFIGGNAILTSGNFANMNWVYHPGDLENADRSVYPNEGNPQPYGGDASSGTSDWTKSYDTMKDKDGNDVRNTAVVLDAYPSKGFPRTTVNVPLLPLNTSDHNGVIYMGEAVSPRLILSELKNEYVTETYYLEYLKRYAYQRYAQDYDQVLGDKAKSEMDRPLLDLLTEWLEFDNETEPVKAFSIPYLYLPQVEWDEKSGKIALDGEGKAKKIYNNVGRVDINGRDVVGVLTYRWEQLNPEPGDPYDPIKDFVKKDTERLQYSLTVEFTPLRVGDSYEVFEEISNSVVSITAEGFPIISVTAAGENETSFTRVSSNKTGIFEDYLMIDSAGKGKVGSNTRLDREKYINGDPTGSDHRGEYALIQDPYYKWDKKYKPSVGKQELIDTTGLSEENYPYGNAEVINDGRTLTAFSQYTIDVVSGDIIPELKLLIGELEEALEKAYDLKTGHYKLTFTLTASRKFKDTDLIDEIRKRATKWDDYGETFEITFELDLSETDIAKLKKEAEADPDGYVRVYAKTKTINAEFGGQTTTLTCGLPIGTYEFKLDNVELGAAGFGSVIRFVKMECDRETVRFQNAYQSFDPLVLRGLNTTNEDPIKWRKDLRVRAAEITKARIGDYRSNAKSADAESAVFYIGTSQTDPEAHRGYVDKNLAEPKRYTNDRLGIVLLSTGSTLLTVRETGAQTNESFLYRITGMTLGGKPVSLVISVTGEGKTTVEILPGNYTVTEISDWGWRYENVDTYDTNYKNDKDDERRYSRVLEDGEIGGDWDVTKGVWKEAYTELRYRTDNPVVDDHHDVTFAHERNDKVWLGGENHEDNKFKDFVKTES